MNRRWWKVAALVALVSAGEARSSARGSEPRLYDPGRDPSRDLSAAILEAKRDQKRVLLEVGGNWCGWCRELERFLHADAPLTKALRCAFVVVRVNVSPENANARFLSSYPEVPGYPYFFVLDDGGALLAAVDSDDFLEGESYDRKKLLAFVRRWSLPEAAETGSER